MESFIFKRPNINGTLTRWDDGTHLPVISVVVEWKNADTHAHTSKIGAVLQQPTLTKLHL